MAYSKAELKKEMLANVFACCLLMPEEIFLEQMKELKEQNKEEETLLKLSKIFQVPLFAVVMRINLLNL